MAIDKTSLLGAEFEARLDTLRNNLAFENSRSAALADEWSASKKRGLEISCLIADYVELLAGD